MYTFLPRLLLIKGSFREYKIIQSYWTNQINIVYPHFLFIWKIACIWLFLPEVIDPDTLDCFKILRLFYFRRVLTLHDWNLGNKLNIGKIFTKERVFFQTSILMSRKLVMQIWMMSKPFHFWAKCCCNDFFMQMLLHRCLLSLFSHVHMLVVFLSPFQWKFGRSETARQCFWCYFYSRLSVW